MGVAFVIEPEKCTECKRCVVACSLHHDGYIQPMLARIGIQKRWPEAPFIHVCRFEDCEEKPCIEVCPADAIYEKDGYILIDSEACIRCGACVPACPYHGIFMNDQTGEAIKCDFCGGDPACVKECVTEAITVKEVE